MGDTNYDYGDQPVVHHWLLCRDAAVESPVGPMNLYTLHGVGFYQSGFVKSFELPPPKLIERLDLFARFFGGQGPREFEIRIHWIDAPEMDEVDSVEVYGPFTVHFSSDWPSRDYLFSLRNVPIAGQGRYAVRLHDINASPFESEYEPMAVEYFEVTDET